MKFNMKAVAASVLFAVAGTSQADILNALAPYGTDGELFVSIFRDTASPESMIVDTGISLLALQAGTVTGWSSSASQTAAILGFLGTAPSTSFRFNAGGLTFQRDQADGSLDPNNYDGFFTTLSPTADPDIFLGGELGTPKSNTQAFITEINNAWGTAQGGSGTASFVNDGYIGGLTDGEAGYHYAPLWGNNLGGAGLNNENVVGTQARLVNVLNVDPNDPFEFGFEIGYNQLGFLNIDAQTGVASLSQGAPSAVPVPAAAWLLGSGLVGLVGVARRRTA
jgi:hypothetical protein